MKHRWYNNDYVISFAVVAAFVLAAIGNYYYHGGHIVW